MVGRSDIAAATDEVRQRPTDLSARGFLCELLCFAGELERKVYNVPEEIDREIARLKLATLGVEIDTLTDEQAKYLASWDEGT